MTSSVLPPDTDKSKLFGETIADIRIPPRPLILDQIAVEAARDEPILSTIAAIISRDVLLSAGMIKLANSPFFGLRVRVKTAHQAVMMLGMELSIGVITGMVLRQSFPPGPSMERFWDSSARIAQVSGWLAATQFPTLQIDSGDAYTFGLFRDCGIAVLMQKFKHYQSTLREANQQSKLKFTDVERMYHPTTHTMVGCLMARTWWLPEYVTIAIREHHEPEALMASTSALSHQSRGLIAIAQLAEHIVQTTHQESSGCEWSKLGAYCLHTLEIDVERVSQLCDATLSIENNEI